MGVGGMGMAYPVRCMGGRNFLMGDAQVFAPGTAGVGVRQLLAGTIGCFLAECAGIGFWRL